MQYLILVVIYNKRLRDSETILSLIKSASTLSGSTIFVWDNSLSEQHQSEISWLRAQCTGVNILYKSTPENLSLSKIYNRFLVEAGIVCDFVVLTDHDTVFDQEFFNAHATAVQQSGSVNLYLPKVVFKDGVVSPGKQFFYKSFPYKTLESGVRRARNNTAVNSGMIIRCSYFCGSFTGYDERLSFYGTDDYFMMQYRKANKYFYVLDYIIQHDLTCSPFSSDLPAFRKSFNDAQSAFLILHSNGRRYSIAGLVVFLRRLKHTLAFKINFFKV